MKRLSVVTFIAVFLFSLAFIPATALADPSGYWTDGLVVDGSYAFGGGSGTEAEPYLISSLAHLAQLCVNVNDPTDGTSYSGACFRMTADIDLGAKYWTPIGWSDSHASCSFLGRFDGNGHVIQNMTVNEPAAINTGLFGYTEGAIIENLGVTGCAVTAQSNSGGLLGYALYGMTTIRNCYTTGSVTISLSGAGGLVGRGICTIDGCHSSASVTGSSVLGGLAGHIEAGSITNSYATGAVTGAKTGSIANNSGGFVGLARESTLEKCYATGDVLGGSTMAGFVGLAEDSTIKNCYSRGSVTFESAVSSVSNAGSFIARSNSTLTNCYGAGAVDVGTYDYTFVGGFCGYNYFGSYTRCFYDRTLMGDREAIGINGTGTTPESGITGLATANTAGMDALDNPDKMDSLNSGDGAPVSGVPIWYAHNATPPTFEPEKYTVTFDSKGAETEASPSLKTVNAGDTVDALPTPPQKTGYTFGGWWTDVNGGGTEFTNSTPINGELTVYAKWTREDSETVYTNGRVTLTPLTLGGTWSYDGAYVALTENSDGTATIEGLVPGTTTVTYTADGAVESFLITVRASDLPATGQNFTPGFILCGLALVVLASVMAASRIKRRRRSF